MPKRLRRGPGEGSWFTRTRTTPAGRIVSEWRHVVSLGVDENGRRVRRTFSGPTKSAVALKVAKAKAAAGGQIQRKTSLTLKAFLEEWLDSVERSRAATTARAYGQRIRRFAIPILGGMPLVDVDAQAITRLYGTLSMRGETASNIAKLHAALRRAFNVGIGQGVLTRNPVLHVARPTHKAKKRVALSAEEAARLLDAAQGHRLEALVRLAIFGGLRPGELTALRWPDIDLKAGVVDVRHSLRDHRGALSLVEAKADSARRIPLEQSTIAALSKHKAAMKAEGHNAEFVFVTPGGFWMRSNNVNAALAEIAKAAKVPKVTGYTLRHTAISLLAESGAHLRVAADLAGHSTTILAADVYTHTTPAQHRMAVENVATLLSKK
jgi:integrase